MTPPHSVEESGVGAASQPLRIAMVGAFPFHPLRFEGGVEASTWSLIEGLTQIGGVDIHVITTKSTLRTPIRFRHEGVSYHYLPSPRRWNTITGGYVMKRRITSELENLDPHVVHALDAVVHGPLCIGSDYPNVVSVHGIVSEEAGHLGSLRDRLRRRVHGWRQRRTVEKARFLIQPTPYPEDYFRGQSTGIWFDTGNAISGQYFDIERDPVKGRLLYVGSIIRRKRLVDLVHAVGKSVEDGRSLHVRVAGPPVEEDYLREVLAAVDAEGLRDRFEFLGLLDPPDLAAEYRRCEMLVLPSAQETSPMVIGEAMAAGVAVIATAVGGIGELVNDGETGLIVPVGDVSHLSTAINSLHDDPERRDSMAKEGREAARARFQSRAVARRVLDVYERAIDAAGSPS